MFIISGAPSTGKSTLIQALAREVPDFHRRFCCVVDGGRWWVERQRELGAALCPIDAMTQEERRMMQMDIMGYYEDQVAQAEAQGRVVIADAFYAEVLVYSLSCLPQEDLDRIRSQLIAHRDSMQVMLLPATHIDLIQDGLRHGNEAFRMEVEQQIRSLYREVGISYREATSPSLADRVALARTLLGV